MAESKNEPKKPSGIVETGENDQGFKTYQRNDGIRLTDAESNDWYRMMTAGEDLETSRRIWNGYIKTRLQNWPAHEREELLESLNITLNNIEDWAEGDEKRLEARLDDNIPKMIDNYQIIRLSNLNFSDYFFVEGFIFPRAIRFENSRFQKMADFSNAQFSSVANFSNAQFAREADFSNAQFSFWAYFSNAQFSSWVDFTEGIFKNRTNFSKATFDGATRFGNRKFQTRAPEFYGAEFHPDITLPDKPECYPNLDNLKHKIEEQIESNDRIKKSDKSKKAREEFKRQLTSQKNAYTELRRQMSALHKIDEEQFFQRQEMACERHLVGVSTSLIYALYDFFSEYGWSLYRPFVSLAWIMTLGALFYSLVIPQMGAGFAWLLSIASTMPLFGTRRELMMQINGEPLAVYALSMTQTLLGVVLLFLFILALRNRFRLR